MLNRQFMAQRESPSILAAIALGSNQGHSLEILGAALRCLGQTPGIQVLRCSPWYPTQAVGPPQPDYWNGCVLVSVTLGPEDLLAALHHIETQFGRQRSLHWGPRTLDLDLLLYGDRVMETPHMELPHPRLHERAFVLVPLADIFPEGWHPVLNQSIAQLVHQVDCRGVNRAGRVAAAVDAL